MPRGVRLPASSAAGDASGGPRRPARCLCSARTVFWRLRASSLVFIRSSRAAFARRAHSQLARETAWNSRKLTLSMERTKSSASGE